MRRLPKKFGDVPLRSRKDFCPFIGCVECCNARSLLCVLWIRVLGNLISQAFPQQQATGALFGQPVEAGPDKMATRGAPGKGGGSEAKQATAWTADALLRACGAGQSGNGAPIS